ncbi:hypothetical protein WDV76_04530 [Xenorhabdus griffiniae]|uniref:hypothetical protein n=1 Tax=Xenorhabdus griffiniae TaxID=351672 RepID=UPI0030CDD483
MKNNINALLSGRTLLAEIQPKKEEDRSWIEISLQDELKPSYPFRTEPYAMLARSPYANKCDESNAKFKLRISSFLASDIENGFDPSYDSVGDYIKFNSLIELENYLNSINVMLDSFVDSSDDDDYPL